MAPPARVPVSVEMVTSVRHDPSIKDSNWVKERQHLGTISPLCLEIIGLCSLALPNLSVCRCVYLSVC